MAKGEVCKTFIQRFDSARRLHCYASRSPRLVVPWITLSLTLAGLSPAFAETRTVRGTVASITAEHGAVSVRSSAGVVELVVGPGAVVLLNKRPATLAEFAVGREVTARYTASTKPPHRVYDLVDVPTWSWLQRMRREITQVTMAEVDENGVAVLDATTQAPFRYRVTDKTRIEVGGKPAVLADLSAGSTLYVAPRLLPNGSTMAVAIGDSASLVARLRERSQPTVTGVVRSWSSSERILALHSRAGDDRRLIVASDCVVRREGRDVTVGALRAGMTVTAHVRHGTAGEELVTRLTIKKAPSSDAKKKAR